MTWKTFKWFNSYKGQQRLLKFLIASAMGVFFILWGGHGKEVGVLNSLGSQSAIAQSPRRSLRPEGVAEIVYQRLPYIPKENQYTRQENGEVDEDHTLISRLVRYHQDIKKRPPFFRLDWKLTLADYLGANETIKHDRYPGYRTLTTNPAESDIQAIRNLNRRQRQELVDLLASLFQQKQENSSTTDSPAESTPEPSPSRSPSQPSLSQPGDAQLLMP